jgi:hypothetical protein
MHGVTLTLETNHLPLLAYAREHLNGLVVSPVSSPDVAVKCLWSQGDWHSDANPFAVSGNGTLNVIGKRMLGNANELIWLDTLRMPGLQLRFFRDQEQLQFDLAYHFHPKKGKLDVLPEYEHKKYFSLMSYLVYYPLIWYLENYRGWTVLHASALAMAGGGIIIGGLGGVGKTTTCVALMQRPGVELMSENLILTDGEFIYACYEPIRLDEDSLAMLGANPRGLTPMAFPDGLKKKWLFHLSTNGVPEKVHPRRMFLPQFAPDRYVINLMPELAAEKMTAMNRLTRELDDYTWYAAALEMHWPKAGQASQRIEVLRQFMNKVCCLELGIDRSAGLKAVVEDIFASIQ